MYNTCVEYGIDGWSTLE